MEDIASIISNLQAEVCHLQAENALFKGEISVLKSKVCLLESENKSLREENGKLKEKLGLTSKNSSIPSSKEFYKLKRNKPKSIRKPGGQPGHAGTTRSKLVADEVVELSISASCSCGGVVKVSAKPYIHQKVDLPPIKPYVIDYHVHHGRCRKCGKRHTASLPQGVTSDTFGPRIKSVISALTGFYKNSKQEVCHILKDIFNLDISIGSISNTEGRVASKCKGAYQAIEETLRKSKLVHIDETGHRTPVQV